MSLMKFSKKLIAAGLSAAVAVSALSAPAMTGYAASELEQSLANDSGLDYDFARALQYSMYMYDANMCGTEVDEKSDYVWRGDCHAYDAVIPLQPMNESSVGTNLTQAFINQYKDVLDPDGDGCVDVAGGMHDAGDHVKFGMPENYSAAALGWGYYEFRDAYVKTGQDGHIETILRYFNDYLMKCTFRDSSGTVIAHCYQVGDGDIDHAFWNSPEIDQMSRPAFFLTADKPQTDYVVSAAGSLALNYLNFKDTDPEYAQKSLDYAQALWKFANDNPKELSDNADGPKGYYRSNKWEDDYCWAAAWLFLCTEDPSYLEVSAEYVDYYAPSGWCFCWNDMWSGANTMWGVINQTYPELGLVDMVRTAQGKNQYVYDDFWDEVEKCFPVWQNLETPGGYAFLNQWGSARYNTAMQLIALVYDKYNNNGQPGAYSEWAKSQMEYIMGDNPLGRSYIVGYNENSVKFPHHRAASGLTKCEDPDEHRYVLYGALAGGPDGQDNHIDVTSDYIYNEVTIDYNAAFVGACAGLYEFFGTEDMKATSDFPPAPAYSEGEGGGNGYWVEACGIDDLQTTGAGVTKVSFMVMTDATKALDNTTVRYYFNSSEMSNPMGMAGSELYDQSATEAAPADGVISGPYKYDKLEDTYYFEITWDGYNIANSAKKYQFTVGTYYGDNWDPTNDWSYQGLTMYQQDDAFFGTGNEVKNENMCVYSDGVLIGGIEPDGTKPDTGTSSETETTTTTTSTTTTTTAATTTMTETTTTTTATETTAPTETSATETTATTTVSAAETSTTALVPENATYGDLNLDGKVALVDLVYLNKYIIQTITLNDQAVANANCCLDERINSADATALLEHIIEQVKELPVYPD